MVQTTSGTSLGAPSTLERAFCAFLALLRRGGRCASAYRLPYRFFVAVGVRWHILLHTTKTFTEHLENCQLYFVESRACRCRPARPGPPRGAAAGARARHTRAAGVRYGPGAGAPPPDTPTSAQGQIHLIYYRVLQKTNSSSTTPPPAARRKSNWEREQ
jgi:hypothetical protein